MLKDIFDLVVSLFRSKQTQRSAVLAIPLTAIPFLLLSLKFNLSPRDHWNYLTSRDSNLMRAEMASQLKDNNTNIEQYTFLSFDKQQELAHLLQKGGGGEAGPETVRKALENSSDNYELIRSLLEFGTIYREMVHSGINDNISHNILSDMLEGIVLVNSSKKREDRSESCDGMERGYQKFSSLNNRVDILPPAIADDAQIEIFRYLTYAASFLRGCELKKSSEQSSRAYANVQKIYTDRAEKILNRKKNLRDSEYLRKYWWIDYSLFIRHISSSTPDETKEADRAFERLMRKLPPDFLRDKIIQHRKLIDPSRQQILDYYRNRL
jgi:hypothetical protein